MNSTLVLPRSGQDIDQTLAPAPNPVASPKPDSQSAAHSSGKQAALTVKVFSSFDDARSAWAQLEAGGHGTVCQREAWCRTWFETCADAAVDTPAIVVAYQDDVPVLLLPLLARPDLFGMLSAQFMGDDHANVRIALTSADAAARERLATLGESGELTARILDALRAQTRISHLYLDSMPEVFAGVSNPLACADWTQSPALTFMGSLQADFDGLTKERLSKRARSKLRQKRRKLQERGNLTLLHESDPERKKAALETFFEQKRARQHLNQSTSNFDKATNQQFAQALVQQSHADATDEALLEIYTLRLNEEPIVIMGGARCKGCFSLAILSMTDDPDIARQSPGLLAVHDLIETLCAQGVSLFDFGLGDMQYKRSWGTPVSLRTVSHQVRPQGLILRAKQSGFDAIRRFVLANETRARFVRAMRFKLAKLRGRA